jgi:hypothetical protein
VNSDEGWEPEGGGLGSQMAAIKALASDGASPYEAKQAARRAFGVAQ